MYLAGSKSGVMEASGRWPETCLNQSTESIVQWSDGDVFTSRRRRYPDGYTCLGPVSQQSVRPFSMDDSKQYSASESSPQALWEGVSLGREGSSLEWEDSSLEWGGPHGCWEDLFPFPPTYPLPCGEDPLPGPYPRWKSLRLLHLKWENVPYSSNSRRPSLPVELWMQILDVVLKEQNYDAIARCARVCRLFQHMCKPHLATDLTFRSEEDVENLKTDIAVKEIGGWRGPMRMIIGGNKDSKAIPHVASIASKFAGRWTRVEKLTIEKASWPSSLRAADAAVFRNLPHFASITQLVLDDVTFPSIVTFGALVSALSGLKELYLRDVKLTISSFLFDPRALSEFRLLPQPKNLWRIYLGTGTDRYDLEHRLEHDFTPTAWPYYTELLDFMTAVSNPRGKSPRVYPWGSVSCMKLDESVWWRFSSSSIVRLLRALPSLTDLTFTSADEKTLNLKMAAVRTHSRSTRIDIVVKGSTARPQHMDNIVRCFIKTDHPIRITEIETLAHSRLQETAMGGPAMNEVVRHAGPSLHRLEFFINADKMSGGSRPDQHHTLALSADRYHHLDLSENTNLQSLRIHHHLASCVDMCEILSRVTSRCISSVYIEITTGSSKPTEQGELSEGLSRLDAVLSLPVFDNLVNVSIQPSLVVEHDGMEESMKACLTSLGRRGILMIGAEVSSYAVHDTIQSGTVQVDGTEQGRTYLSGGGTAAEKGRERGQVALVSVTWRLGDWQERNRAAHDKGSTSSI
ncbi:predicted protein [Postia placenta Mad-698-R]|uniref:F-box domain-containing protein n=1 Tax=Postia placenta MAD-698-R-SB12 TaxID=670580 RepID=A0A1X6N1B8_9APHY|nr:hypothetical protein POSPLADRAFT_1143642 [Postia placenta MAD-698-R-SB12]EED83295.1 predicted protein [Postia placenta Mad-698-R]OSX62407.1 hypothetical protein POSPLADRAFT_1143642 [Postia placenta MAD-698-R-SB12]